MLGPFILHEHLYNTRTGSVFRVTDVGNNEYALKVFTYGDDVVRSGHKERRLFDYGNERSYMVNTTRDSCPLLLSALSTKDMYGKRVDCVKSHHVQLLLGLDVPVFDDANGEQIGMRKVRLMNSVGQESDRQLDFNSNTLIPYMAGGRLSDLIARVPKYQSMVVRYPLYVDVAPQVVEAVRFLHSNHIAHLGIQASTILCSNVNCDYAVLADPANAWNGEGSSMYANELMQQSVRFTQFSGEESTEEVSQVVPVFAKYLSESAADWEGAMKVDWYGLGGTLFYILTGMRPVAEDRTGPNSHDVAEFIYKALQSKQLLSKVPTEEAKASLAKIRDHVTEGLLLVDGLLQTDRSKRISFDNFASFVETAKNLRRSKSLMSAIQLDKNEPRTSNCMKFISDSASESQTLSELPVTDKATLPSFLQDICH